MLLALVKLRIALWGYLRDSGNPGFSRLTPCYVMVVAIGARSVWQPLTPALVKFHVRMYLQGRGGGGFEVVYPRNRSPNIRYQILKTLCLVVYTDMVVCMSERVPGLGTY